MKVKLTKLFHPNISKLTTENGGRGTHFAKFLISLFQWGLTHSAVMTLGERGRGEKGKLAISFNSSGETSLVIEYYDEYFGKVQQTLN